jgi:hypothetical protein
MPRAIQIKAENVEMSVSETYFSFIINDDELLVSSLIVQNS